MIEFKPRYFVLPAIALTVLAMLYAPAEGGRTASPACTIHTRDGGIRASFERFERTQSATAAKVCALAGNNLP